MQRNLGISTVKRWAEATDLEEVKMVEEKKALVCLMLWDDAFIPLFVRLDNGFLVFSLVVTSNVEKNVELYEKSLQLSNIVPAKVCLDEKDLMIVIDVRIHQGFDKKDFQEALSILKEVVEDYYLPLKLFTKEKSISTKASNDFKDRFHWPKGLLSIN